MTDQNDDQQRCLPTAQEADKWFIQTVINLIEKYKSRGHDISFSIDPSGERIGNISCSKDIEYKIAQELSSIYEEYEIKRR